MIQIKPYYERPNKNEILTAYLALLDRALPFLKEDLYHLAVEKFELDRDCLQGIVRTRPPTDAERRKGIDAERIIQTYSERLHDFLYDQTAGDGHINVDRLYQLLTVSMIEEVWEWKRMDFAQSPPPKDGAQLLKHIFRYEAVSRDKRRMYEFTKQLKTEVCPYCNRIFTATIQGEEDDPYGIRPQLDHFKSKDKYPFFAMSILNWVPSCSFCNLRKSVKDEKLLYPYVEGAGQNYVFKTYCSPTDGHTGHAFYVTGVEDTENSFIIRGEPDPCIPDQAAYIKRLRCIQEAKKAETLSSEELEAQKMAYMERLKRSADLFC